MFLWVTGRAMSWAASASTCGVQVRPGIPMGEDEPAAADHPHGRTGHWINHSKEHCLVGVKGKLADKLNLNLDCDVVCAEVRETSRKPDEMYDLLERLAPGQRSSSSSAGRTTSTRDGRRSGTSSGVADHRAVAAPAAARRGHLRRGRHDRAAAAARRPDRAAVGRPLAAAAASRPRRQRLGSTLDASKQLHKNRHMHITDVALLARRRRRRRRHRRRAVEPVRQRARRDAALLNMCATSCTSGDDCSGAVGWRAGDRAARMRRNAALAALPSGRRRRSIRRWG